jgi:hypothetical protein
MIFTDFLKAVGRKNKYGMVSTNLDTRTELSHIVYNVLRLCDGGEIEAEKLNLLLMFNQGTNVEFCTSTPLLQNRCYVPLFFKLWFHTI